MSADDHHADGADDDHDPKDHHPSLLRVVDAHYFTIRVGRLVVPLAGDARVVWPAVGAAFGRALEAVAHGAHAKSGLALGADAGVVALFAVERTGVAGAEVHVEAWHAGSARYKVASLALGDVARSSVRA